MPISGEIVLCDMCSKYYSYFIWAFGSDKCLCRNCVHKRPAAYLDNLDVIDIEKELDIISEEIHEFDTKGDPRKPMGTSRSLAGHKLTPKEVKDIWNHMAQKTISKHRKREATKK